MRTSSTQSTNFKPKPNETAVAEPVTDLRALAKAELIRLEADSDGQIRAEMNG